MKNESLARQILKTDLKQLYSGSENARKYIKNTGLVVLSLIVFRLFALVTPIYISDISNEYLTAYSLLMYISFLGTLMGSVMGQPMFHIVKFDGDPVERDEALGSVIIITTIGILIVFAIILPFKEILLAGMKVSSLPGARIAFYLILLSSAMRAMSNVLYYAVSALKSARALVILDILALLVAIAGSHFLVGQSHVPEIQFMLLVSVLPICDFLYLAGCLWVLRDQIAFSLRLVKRSWKKYKEVIPDYFKNWVLTISLPLITSTFFLWSLAKEATAAYNMGLLLLDCAAVPIAAISMTSPAWVAPTMWFGGKTESYRERIKVIFFLSITLSISILFLALPSMKSMAEGMFNFHEPASFAIIICAVVCILPEAMSTHLICQFQIRGRQDELARARIVTGYLLGLPLTYLAIKFGHIILAGLMSTIVPDTLYSLWLYFKRDDPPDFISSAHHFSNSNLVNVNVTFLDSEKSMKNLNISLINITVGGFAVRIKNSSRSLYPAGVSVIGYFSFADSAEIDFEAKVRNSENTNDAKTQNSTEFELDLEFVNIAEADLLLIKNLVLGHFNMRKVV